MLGLSPACHPEQSFFVGRYCEAMPAGTLQILNIDDPIAGFLPALLRNTGLHVLMAPL